MFSNDELSNDELDDAKFRLFNSNDSSVIDRHLNRFSCVLSRLAFVDLRISSSDFIRFSADLKSTVSSSELIRLSSFDFNRFSADLNRFSFDLTSISTIDEGNDELVDSVVDEDELVDEIDCLEICVKVDLSCALLDEM